MVISSLKVIRVVAETVTIPASCPWKCSEVVASRPGCGIRKQAMSPKQLMRSRRSVCSPGGCRLPRSTYTRTAAPPRARQTGVLLPARAKLCWHGTSYGRGSPASVSATTQKSVFCRNIWTNQASVTWCLPSTYFIHRV